jgi:hypothetical protein
LICTAIIDIDCDAFCSLSHIGADRTDCGVGISGSRFPDVLCADARCGRDTYQTGQSWLRIITAIGTPGAKDFIFRLHNADRECKVAAPDNASDRYRSLLTKVSDYLSMLLGPYIG